MKRILTIAILITASIAFSSAAYAESTASSLATNNLPDGHHIIFFEENILERHRDVFSDTFITDTYHMDWLIAEYDRLFDTDWHAYDVLRLVIEQNFELIADINMNELLELPVLAFRDKIMAILYAIDVDELELNDFVGGLRWSVYNMDLELTVETLVERMVYVMGFDNLIHLTNF